MTDEEREEWQLYGERGEQVWFSKGGKQAFFLSIFVCLRVCVWLTMEMVWRFSKGIDLRVECVPAAL